MQAKWEICNLFIPACIFYKLRRIGVVSIRYNSFMRKLFYNSIFIPIAISIFSVTGIILILLNVYFEQPNTSAEATPSPTPFKYLLLATETGVPDPSEIRPTETIYTPPPPTEAELSVESSNTDSPPTNTPLGVTSAPTIDEALIFTEGIYDDIDERIMYEGDWVNEIVETAYGETLFVSTTIGDTASFTFIGTQLQIAYLEDASLGVVIVRIDEVEYSLDQSSGSEWLSPELPFGEHSALLIHESGDVILLDYINILGSQ